MDFPTTSLREDPHAADAAQDDVNVTSLREDPHAADAAQDDVNVTTLREDPHAADAAQDDVNVTSLRVAERRGNLCHFDRAERVEKSNDETEY